MHKQRCCVDRIAIAADRRSVRLKNSSVPTPKSFASLGRPLQSPELCLGWITRVVDNILAHLEEPSSNLLDPVRLTSSSFASQAASLLNNIHNVMGALRGRPSRAV